MPSSATLARQFPKLVAVGLRSTAAGRFSVVRCVTHQRRDFVNGRPVVLGYYTTHNAIPGSHAKEAQAEAKARALAASANVEYVGYGADAF